MYNALRTTCSIIQRASHGMAWPYITLFMAVTPDSLLSATGCLISSIDPIELQASFVLASLWLIMELARACDIMAGSSYGSCYSLSLVGVHIHASSLGYGRQ